MTLLIKGARRVGKSYIAEQFGKYLLSDFIRESYAGRKTIPEALHRKTMQFFKENMFIDGIPQVVI